jgi:hypothetical protein
VLNPEWCKGTGRGRQLIPSIQIINWNEYTHSTRHLHWFLKACRCPPSAKFITPDKRTGLLSCQDIDCCRREQFKSTVKLWNSNTNLNWTYFLIQSILVWKETWIFWRKVGLNQSSFPVRSLFCPVWAVIQPWPTTLSTSCARQAIWTQVYKRLDVFK